jgi:hypothetical protein
VKQTLNTTLFPANVNWVHTVETFGVTEECNNR